MRVGLAGSMAGWCSSFATCRSLQAAWKHARRRVWGCSPAHLNRNTKLANLCKLVQVVLRFPSPTQPLCAPALLQGPHASLAVRLSQRDPGRTFVLVRGKLLVSFGTTRHSAQLQCVQLSEFDRNVKSGDVIVTSPCPIAASLCPSPSPRRASGCPTCCWPGRSFRKTLQKIR